MTVTDLACVHEHDRLAKETAAGPSARGSACYLDTVDGVTSELAKPRDHNVGCEKPGCLVVAMKAIGYDEDERGAGAKMCAAGHERCQHVVGISTDESFSCVTVSTVRDCIQHGSQKITYFAGTRVIFVRVSISPLEAGMATNGPVALPPEIVLCLD